MIRKSINELKNIPGFYEKPWLVVGTGPSIENIFPFELNIQRFNIWAINHAVNFITHVTVASLVDTIAVKEVRKHPFTCKAILTKDGFSAFPIEHKDKVHYFNYKGEETQIPDVITLASSCSSSLAFNVLGMLDIKFIYSVGLDGGIGAKHPFFNFFESVRNTKELKIDYDLHNAGCDHWCRVYNINWHKIK